MANPVARGYEVVADSIRAQDVDVVFGLLGNSNLATVGVLSECGVRYIGSRHEAGAVSMAMGYAWASGRSSLCTVTHGPGLCNALTALASAAGDRIPMVVFVGDIQAEPSWMAQRADHRAMTAWTGVDFLDCPAPEALAASVSDAFGRARQRRRPVILNIPTGYLNDAAPQQCSAHPDTATPETGRSTETPLAPVVEMLRAARRPILLAGRGAAQAGAGPPLRQLAARSGALLATTLPAKGLFANDPFDIGVCGGYSGQVARELLADADCVAVFGASLNGYTTDGGALIAGKPMIQCDVDAAALGRYTPVDAPVVADAATAATAMVEALGVAGADRTGYRTDEVARRIMAERRGDNHSDTSGDDGLDPRTVLRVLDNAFPADRQVIIDVGHFSTFPSQLLAVPEAGRLLPAFGFGAVGLAIAAGVGAALGRPIPTLVVVGDGGALMALGELDTIRRAAAPVTIVVLNDAAYGAEIHHLRRHGLDDQLARFPRCDLSAVAAAVGLPAVELRTLAGLEQLAGPVGGESSLLLDARVTRRVIADKFR